MSILFKANRHQLQRCKRCTRFGLRHGCKEPPPASRSRRWQKRKGFKINCFWLLRRQRRRFFAPNHHHELHPVTPNAAECSGTVLLDTAVPVLVNGDVHLVLACRRPADRLPPPNAQRPPHLPIPHRHNVPPPLLPPLPRPPPPRLSPYRRFLHLPAHTRQPRAGEQHLLGRPHRHPPSPCRTGHVVPPAQHGREDGRRGRVQGLLAPDREHQGRQSRDDEWAPGGECGRGGGTEEEASAAGGQESQAVLRSGPAIEVRFSFFFLGMGRGEKEGADARFRLIGIGL